MADHNPSETLQTTAGVSRRNLLRGATVAGTLAWSAPLVVTVATPAFAGSPSSNANGTGFSFIAVLLRDALGVVYRAKFNFSGANKPTFTFGRDFQIGKCTTTDGTNLSRGLTTVNTADPRTPSSYGFTDAPIQDFTLLPDGTFSLLLAPSVTLVNYVVHQGKCCIEKPTTDKGTKAYPVKTTSVLVAKPVPAPKAGIKVYNIRHSFPAAPNKAPCSLAR